jgi:hypothetical protein
MSSDSGLGVVLLLVLANLLPSNILTLSRLPSSLALLASERHTRVVGHDVGLPADPRDRFDDEYSHFPYMSHDYGHDASAVFPA